MRRFLALVLASMAGSWTSIVSAALVSPHNTYELGTWSSSIDSETYTGNGVDSKAWEYDNVVFPNSSNTNPDPSNRRVPSYFVSKYNSTTPIGGLKFRYSDGYIQEDIAGSGSRAFVAVSTDGVNYTEIWQQVQQIPGPFTQFFVMPDYVTYNLPTAATSLYVKHEITFAYDGLWQMGGSHSTSGFIFTESVPEPASLGVIPVSLAAMLGRRRRLA